MTAAANYTPELTAQITKAYTEGASIEAIAEEIGKSVRSVRSKLVREGVYQAPEKPVKATRDNGPTKKEILIELDAVYPFDPTGLMGATKEALQQLLEYVNQVELEDAAEESEAA